MAAALAWPLAALLLVVTITDLRGRWIPDAALVPAAAVAVGVFAVGAPGALPARASWALAAGGLLLAAALLRPDGMGLGDVKLAAVLGLYLGEAVATALLVAFGAGAAWGAVVVARHGWAARSRTLPFAPFLATGAAVAWVAADNLARWS